jgi:multifunctional 2-oxoglutarate metabolism enzyme
MGSWTFLQPLVDEILDDMFGNCARRLQYVGRHASASPATGSAKVHAAQQADIVRRALGED